MGQSRFLTARETVNRSFEAMMDNIMRDIMREVVVIPMTTIIKTL